MQIEINKILKKVKEAKCKNESAATLWLIACMAGLEKEVVLVEDVDIQRLSRAGLLERDVTGIVINIDFDYNEVITDEDVSEYRELWRGLFTGSMGSANNIKEKATRWLKNNPGYTFDDIKKAAVYWIESKKREVSNPNLIGQADFFIYKKEGKGKEETSRLSSIIDEAVEVGNMSQEWYNTII